MFNNLVTHHVHSQAPLPASDALAYQYILAGNGLFIRAETCFFEAILPIAACTVRGLDPLRRCFRLKVARIPARLLDTLLTDARRARRPDSGLNEVLYQFHHHGQTVQVKKPAQQATAVTVLAAGVDDERILCDLHSHGNMHAFFSRTDDADEQGAKVYAVIGKLDTAPEIRLRVGVYGYWLPLPVTAVFSGSGPFQDLYQKENES
ncbi:MAG: Mov34/MPN/PAD-1 family protein [Anaerolineae bacterium]|nr:Mov34/MPN/PAD-1 family protein [Anaerolineae bacterium]